MGTFLKAFCIAHPQAIHYSLNLFKSNKIQREAKRQLKHLKELQKYRKVLANASEKYGVAEKV